MGSPVSPIVVNLYMEKFERQALDSYTGVTPSHWYRYVDDTWAKLKKTEAEQFFTHINSIDNNIKFTQEPMINNQLAFLDCLDTKVHRKATHTDQYLLFTSHHPLIHKLGVIRTLNYRAQTIVSQESEKEKEKTHIREALAICGYKPWAFHTALKKKEAKDKKNTNTNSERQNRKVNVTLPYVEGVSEKLARLFNSHRVNTSMKPSNTLRQALVHPKDPVPKDKRSDIVYGIQCADPDCQEAYIGETQQPLKKRMYQHRRSSTSGLDSAVYLHLESSGHNFDNKDVIVVDRESRWFERGVKEAINERSERSSLNQRGGLRFNLSQTWTRAACDIPKVFSRRHTTWRHLP